MKYEAFADRLNITTDDGAFAGYELARTFKLSDDFWCFVWEILSMDTMMALEGDLIGDLFSSGGRGLSDRKSERRGE